MPTYEYVCRACGCELEIFQSMKDAPLTVCPECGTQGQFVRKISGGAGIIFKGSGFYETDYKRKPQEPDAGKSDKAGAQDSPTTKPSGADKATPAAPASKQAADTA
jgi:putative FmdB family regulatory protein